MQERMPCRQPADRAVEIDQRGMLKRAGEGDGLIRAFQLRHEYITFPWAVYII